MYRNVSTAKFATLVFYNTIQAIIYCVALTLAVGHAIPFGVFLLILLALLFTPIDLGLLAKS